MGKKPSELEKKVVKDGYEFIVNFIFAWILMCIIFGIPYYLIHY